MRLTVVIHPLIKAVHEYYAVTGPLKIQGPFRKNALAFFRMNDKG